MVGKNPSSIVQASKYFSLLFDIFIHFFHSCLFIEKVQLETAFQNETLHFKNILIQNNKIRLK